ncbi:MAG: beta-ketoacyl-[acyl-carrier-protein] synthase family protein [Verrucomicrobia bacterium]|nr:beta-ketoacyl-[acyl-carrier-protein] synthase family protein [Verrucomicrobiota bacterium]
MPHRVVITGFGVATTFGFGAAPILDNVFAGRHGFRAIASFDTAASFAKRGGEMQGGERSYRAFLRRCTDDALAEAGLDLNRDHRLLSQAAIAVGNLGDGAILQEFFSQFREEQPDFRATRSVFPNPTGGEAITIDDCAPFTHADALAMQLRSEGPRLAFTNACVASTNAIGWGYDQVRHGRAPCAFVGGLNVLHPLVFHNFDSSRAMTTDIVRPFSKGRTGLLIGDGAAILVLEEREAALARGARPLAEMLGWGISSDGFHVSQPDPSGDGLARAMRMALRKANCQIDEIDYINAHGTGTPLNDKSETKALKQVLGDRAPSIPVSSTKSTTGHMLEATGAVEAVICLLALRTQTIPPTANFVERDEELDLDYVTDGMRPSKLRTVVSNSAAFGGNNCSLVFRRLSHEY